MGYRLKLNPNGNVSKDVFIEGLKRLALMFPTWKMDLSNNETIKLLYKYLGYCTNERYLIGVDKFIESESLNPTVASLKKHIKSSDERVPEIKYASIYDKVEYEPGHYRFVNEERVKVYNFRAFAILDNGFLVEEYIYNDHINKEDCVKDSDSWNKVEIFEDERELLITDRRVKYREYD